jgi:hypothetical protein
MLPPRALDHNACIRRLFRAGVSPAQAAQCQLAAVEVAKRIVAICHEQLPMYPADGGLALAAVCAHSKPSNVR